MLDEKKSNLEEIDLKRALEERYLAYALSTIMHRALPDVRDGLKPVHRRILYAMRLLKLSPNQSYAKCARIVGDVMGKFHPHGDSSIYDALVRLAQDFSVRYPLIDGQGNFGNIDGDNAAAMRYTEARMTEITSFLLDGINEDAIDFRLTYNEEDKEPIVLPAAFPNILANGSSGIAVGMATSIPPHNVAELGAGCLYLIENPSATNKDLLQFVKGPDFPTGGTLITSKEELEEAYTTGRGSFRLRAKWHKETIERGNYVLVVTQIPFQVQKNRLVTKVQELLYARKLPMIDDIRDESAEDVRIVIEPKSKNSVPEILMESLFKLTEFEVRIGLNMNVLTLGKIPNVLSLKEVLQQWLNHRKEVLIRRSRFRLRNIETRLELVLGYLIAYLNLDEIIRIIREEDEPKQVLIASFNLTDNQAEAILNMRLRSLRRLEEIELKKEQAELQKEKTHLEALANSDKQQWQFLAREIQELNRNYGQETALGMRRTEFGLAIEHNLEELEQAMIEKEAVTVIISAMGWTRALKGHLSTTENIAFKEGDEAKFILPAYTTDKLLLASNDGRFFTLAVHSLPGGRGQGEPIRLLLDLEHDQEILDIFIYKSENKLLLVSKQGYGFIVAHHEMLSTTRKGKQIMKVKAPDTAALCKAVSGTHLALIGDNRKMLVFPLADIPHMARGKGVRLQKYKDGGIRDASCFAIDRGLMWRDSAGRSFVRLAEELTEWQGGRATAGRMAPRGFPKSGLFDNEA